LASCSATARADGGVLDDGSGCGGAGTPGPAGQLSWAEQRHRLQLVEMVARYHWGNEQ
jgi:hypothetical protein